MCLETLFTYKQKVEKLKTRSTWVKVYKAVDKPRSLWEEDWKAPYTNGDYKGGLNTTHATHKVRAFNYKDRVHKIYTTLYHSTLTMRAVKYFKGFESCGRKVITCYVKKSWIKNMGTQFSFVVLVSDKIIMPKYPRTELTKDELIKFGVT